MKKTMLIAPFGGALAAAIAAEARAAGWAVALAMPGPPRAGQEKTEDDPGGDTATLSYNPSSYVSVAALVLSARNALGEIDAAVLVADRGSGGLDLVASKPGDIAALVEEKCAGPLYLARELVRRFEARRSGSILMLSSEPPRDASSGPSTSLVDSAFEGLGRGLFGLSSGASWRAYGVQDASSQADRAARFALGLLGEAKGAKAGRWIRFTGRTGIFGGA
ncbi:MAG TPA: hypothetical protein VFL04_05730 [Rectinemataceae bacterium]|nr:hypothetical protein [Rectinemataceae bacterium]